MSRALEPTVVRPFRAPQFEVERVRNRLAAKLYGVASEAAKIAHYEIIDRIGFGAQGEVYLVHDPRLGRELAVKVLRREVDREGVAEARALAQVVHLNVVPVFDVGVVPGIVDEGPRAFIAMEYVNGRSLRAWCEHTAAWADRLRVIVDAGRGLQAVHAAGIVHADFKPSNVVVGDDGRPRVMDFGLARWRTDATTDSESASDQSGGTPGYRAPECDERHADALSDQYGFCVTAWQLLVDLPADVPPAPPQLAELRAILRRGLQARPEDRWPELAPLLDRLAGVSTRRRGPTRAAIAGGLVALALVGSFAFSGMRSDRDRPAALTNLGLGLGLGGMHAQSLLLHGRETWRAGGLAEARTTFERAAHLADARGDDRASAEAILELLELLGTRLAAFEDARRWEPHARAAITRLGDRELQAALDLRWGTILALAGDPAAGRELLHALRERLLADPSLSRVAAADVESELARLEMQAGRSAEALHWAELAVAGQAALVGTEHPHYGAALLRLGAAQEQRSDLVAARRTFEEALATHERVGDGSVAIGTHNSLAIVLERQGERDAAEQHYQIALRAASEQHLDDVVVVTRTNLGSLELARDDLEAASEHFTIARTLAEAIYPAKHRMFVSIHHGLAITHARRGDYERAVESLERSVELATALGMSKADVGRLRSQLGQARWKTGAREVGRAEVEHARREFANDPVAFAEELADADKWLESHPLSSRDHTPAQ